MSRSRRRTPIIANTTSTSEKQDKRLTAGVERAHARDALRFGEQPAPERRHHRSGAWLFDKDGKHYVSEPYRTHRVMGK